jgi:two-component system, cell cycle sensor histidine kinase and response regulator CckA
MSDAQRASAAGTGEADGIPGPGADTGLGGADAGSLRRDALRILILEDNPADAELEQRLLKRAGLDRTAAVVHTRASFEQQLAAFGPDVILADFSLPGFSGESALKIAQEQCPQVPFIFLSGMIGDDAAVELIRQDATDYVLKDRPARLPAVVRRAVDEAGQRSRLARMEAHLQRSQRLEAFGRLAAGVAHEFNNQVGAMLSYAAFIRQEAASRTHHGSDDEAWDGIRRDAEQIEQAGQRVTRLVHQLLTAGGQQISRPGLIDLNQVIGGIDELLRTTAGASIEFRMTVTAWLPAASETAASSGQPAGTPARIMTSSRVTSTPSPQLPGCQLPEPVRPGAALTAGGA